MSKAEERALKAYPKKITAACAGGGGVYSYDMNEQSRSGYIKGYHQAKEDILEWLRKHYIVRILTYFGIDICKDLKRQ